MHKNMNLSALKDQFQQELLNLLQILDLCSLFVLTARLDCEI